MSTLARSIVVLIAALALLGARPAQAQDHAAPAAADKAHATEASHAADAGHGAADHGHDKASVIPKSNQGIISGIATLVVFGLVFAILATKVWPTILTGLRDREDKIRTAIEEAEQARQKAKQAQADFERSLADARAEASKMLETTRAQQAALAAELKAKADVELSQMRERALKDIEGAKRAAVTEIYTQSSQLAAVMAAKILRRNVNAGDTQQLVQESIAQLAGPRN